MLQNYFKIAFRNLVKHRSFTILNTLGLSVGLAACLLILQYVRFEWNYDKISPHTPHLWRAYNETVTNGQVTTQDGNTHSALAPALAADLPEVTDYFRLYNGNKHEVVFFQNNEAVKIHHAWMVDPGFLRLFPQTFIEGNPHTCLTRPWTILLTKSAADRLFPDGGAMGKTLRIPGGVFSGEYLVEGVVADPPQNTHLKFNVLTGYATRYAKGHEDNWGGYWDYTYFRLTPGTDPAKVRRQLAAYSAQHLEKEGIRLAMQPFESIHLHSNLTYEIEPNGNARTTGFLGIVALLTLAIAFINYVNMTTARSLERAKEVGLRKVIGANRRQLAGQFFLEGLLVNGFALLLALALMQHLLPWFGELIGRPLADTLRLDFPFWLATGGMLTLGMLASCGYPALVLTRFQPMQVLLGSSIVPTAGMSRGTCESLFRKGLVVFQFGCSAALIFSLVVVGRQLNYLQNHDKGLSLDQIAAVKTPVADWQQDSLNRLRMGVFKNEIAQTPGIRSVTTSSIAPGLGISTISGTSSGLVQAEKPGVVRPGTVYFIDAEPNFYETYGIRFLAGKTFHATGEDAGFQHVIINQAALAMLGFPSPESALGKELAYPNSTDGYRMKIEGVVANFHIETLKEPARPTLYFCLPDVRNGYISLKVEGGKMQPVLTSLEQAWKKTFPESPFEYWFLNEQFALQYTAETQLSKVFSLFAGLAVFIACLGLYGMSAYSASQRTKEIGIRKVLGATTAGLVRLMSKDFLRLVFIAVFIASPIAWWLMKKWLQDFAYRIEIGWWVFALAGILAIVVAFLTVSFQSMKAALANPVKSLRSE